MSLGITLVSHVSDIANGLPKLLKQVAKDVPITTAGGTDDGRIGTSTVSYTHLRAHETR